MRASRIARKRVRACDDDKLLAKAWRLREAVVEAVAWKRDDRLRQLSRSLLALSPTKKVLRATGLGLLIRDRQIWGGLDQHSQSVVRRAESKWRQCARADPQLGDASTQLSRPKVFAGRKVADFITNRG